MAMPPRLARIHWFSTVLPHVHPNVHQRVGVRTMGEVVERPVCRDIVSPNHHPIGLLEIPPTFYWHLANTLVLHPLVDNHGLSSPTTLLPLGVTSLILVRESY